LKYQQIDEDIYKEFRHYEEEGVPECCKMEYYKKFSISKMVEIRRKCIHMSRIDKSIYIFNNIHRSLDKRKNKTKFIVEGSRVCQKFFIFCNGISKYLCSIMPSIKSCTISAPKERNVVYFLKDYQNGIV
jgi:hypothetical protein